MTGGELAGLSAHNLAAAIRAGDISASEATAAAIARAQAVKPILGAVASLDIDQALADAAAADRLPAEKRCGALFGVPLAHKDMFALAGHVAGWGAKIRADAPAAADATAIARLKAAGAIHFGTLAMSEFAFGITGHNDHFGNCRNPHDLSRIPGGSSSGSAACVAAGVVPFALGSDTGGSVRVPAACCGIAGMRPTWGLISRAGAMPLAPSLDSVGLLARDVADIALALSLLAGADAADATAAAPPADYPAALAMSPRGMRIGVDRALLASVDSRIAPLLEQALAMLLDAGAREIAVNIPQLRQLDRYAQVLQLAEASAFHARWMRERPQDYSEPVQTLLQQGFAMSAVDYLQALRARPLIVGDWLAGPFAEADMLFLPVLEKPVPTLEESDVGAPDLARTIGGLLHFNRPLSYLGLPCLALPIRGDGMPNGFQLVGRPYGEPTLLAMGSAYQKSAGIPQPSLTEA